jgi:AraC family transcriptional regulator
LFYVTWEKLIELAANNVIKHDEQQRFGFNYDNPAVTAVDKCRYDAAIVIGDSLDVKSPFTTTEILKGKYVLYFKGSAEDTIKAQLSLYSDFLPNSGFEPDNFRC